MDDMLQAGIIAATHGIRGEVKVLPASDDPERFRKLKYVWLDTGGGRISLEICHMKVFKQFVILKFKGIDDINEIEKYRGKPLLVKREDAVPLEEDEYYTADLIGLRVRTDTGGELGTVADILETGANDVYVVRQSDGGELLLPAIHDCIKEVRPRDGFITVHIMDGLLDAEYKSSDTAGREEKHAH